MSDGNEVHACRRGLTIVLLIAASAIAGFSVPAAANPDDPPPRVQRSPRVSISYAESSVPLLLTPARDVAMPPGKHRSEMSGFVPSPLMPATMLNFLGQGHTLSPGTVTGVPPDTNGAVGPNHYVQVVNGGIEIWDKAGTVVASSQLLNGLWTGYTGTNAGNGCSTHNDGNPIVLYDQLADRWFVSQFSLTNIGSSPNFQCVAVSKTGNPAGAYWLYDFPYAGVNYDPKFAVWPDAYYATFNIDNVSAALCAYDRASMLNGSAAMQQCFQQSSGVSNVLPASVDGPIRPPLGEPGFFMNFGVNELHLWKLHVDWSNTANATLSSPTTIPVAAFTPACNTSVSYVCIPQPGTTNQLAALSDRLMSRLTYRNFGTYESMLMNHTVVANATSGIHWYEIRSPNATPIVAQQGTYSQNDANWRWLGSIAQDQAQGFVVGFSLSSTTTNPSIAWTGRLATDAPGSMGAVTGEAVTTAGTGVETSIHRWGDYSSMTIDPSDDCTFWFTTELYLTTGISTWDTKIASVKFPNCAANNFSISIAPASQTVVNGGQVAYTVSTGSIAGAPETIVLNVQDLPAGVSASFVPPTVSAGSTSTLTLTATAGAPPTAVPVTFTGVGKAPSAVHAAFAQARVSPAPPTNVVATVNASGVGVTWTASTGAATYDVYRKGAGGSFMPIAAGTGLMTTFFTDTTAAADTAYLYKVLAVNSLVNSPDSNIDLATTTIYTDAPLVAGSTVVQGNPLTQMRTAVNAVRALAGLSASSFTDVPPNGAPMRSMHIIEMRTALNDALSQLLITLPTYTNSAASGTPVQATDFTEIRQAMK
jgi:hypothetical protein